MLLYDCETGDEREVTVTAKVLAALRARPTATYLAEIDALLRDRTRCRTSTADVDVPFDELILRVFRRGGFLR